MSTTLALRYGCLHHKVEVTLVTSTIAGLVTIVFASGAEELGPHISQTLTKVTTHSLATHVCDWCRWGWREKEVIRSSNQSLGKDSIDILEVFSLIPERSFQCFYLGCKSPFGPGSTGQNPMAQSRHCL